MIVAAGVILLLAGLAGGYVIGYLAADHRQRHSCGALQDAYMLGWQDGRDYRNDATTPGELYARHTSTGA
jgi:hypothetical protein